MRDRPSLPALGEVILGKYAIVRVLGKGAMGIVFEAVHVRLGQRVAIKMLRPSRGDLREIVPRFEREARAAAQLQNTHVTRVMDVDVLPDGTPFMVMEYLEGHDLASELKARGPLPIPEAVTWVLQVCEALGEAHRLGIVHRDIKPSNLFLAHSGEYRILKVLDFGISKMASGETDTGETAAFSTFGTPQYMSPEQMRSAKHVDGRTDIWSLGVVLYKLLSMRIPFHGDNAMAIATSVAADAPPPLRQWRPDVPEGLERAVMTALVKNPDGRFQDIGDFAHAIAPFAVATGVESAGMPAETQSPPQSATDATGAPGTASPWSTATQNDVLRQRFSRWLPVALPGIALLLGGIVAMRFFHVLSWGAPENVTKQPDSTARPVPAPAAAPPAPAAAPPAPAAAPPAPAAAPPDTAAATASSASSNGSAARPEEDEPASSSGKWVHIGDRTWLASPLKRPGTDKLEGFTSIDTAHMACRDRANAQVPSTDEFNTLTLDGKGQRDDPQKTRLFDGGRIPIGIYWVDDASTYGSIRSVQASAIIKGDGAYATVAYALCVKNK